MRHSAIIEKTRAVKLYEEGSEEEEPTHTYLHTRVRQQRSLTDSPNEQADPHFEKGSCLSFLHQ